MHVLPQVAPSALDVLFPAADSSSEEEEDEEYAPDKDSSINNEVCSILCVCTCTLCSV